MTTKKDIGEIEDSSVIEFLPPREFLEDTSKYLLEFIKQNDIKDFLELGVLYGDLSKYLLTNHHFERYICVDSWKSSNWGLSRYRQHEMDEVRRLCYENLSSFSNVTIHHNSSVKASCLFDDKSIDCVFIDASHTTEDVIDDIRCWYPRVKRFLIGHDYDYGLVKRAFEQIKVNFEVIKFPSSREMWLMRRSDNG